MKYVLTAFAVISLAGLSAVYTNPGFKMSENFLTGEFTEASPSDPGSQYIYIENVHWEFEDGKNATGLIVQRNFPEGTQNITMTVEKSNGVTETYEKQLEIKR